MTQARIRRDFAKATTACPLLRGRQQARPWKQLVAGRILCVAYLLAIVFTFGPPATGPMQLCPAGSNSASSRGR
jgi:hypothetical protein